MLLFQKRFHDGLVNGAVRLTFRLWDKPHVKVGGRYRVHPIGVVEVDTVEHVPLTSITDEHARLGGFASRDELLEFMKPVAKAPLGPKTMVFKVGLHHGGDGDRVEIALHDDLTDADVSAIDAKLEKLDTAADHPWTQKVMAIIGKHPRVAASQLAKKLGLPETEPFKVDVRKLKKLGLTQSFEVGYEISPRGVAYLKKTRRKLRRR